MSGASVEDVLSRLKRGEDIFSITQSLLSDADAELLGLLAVPRRLDHLVARALLGDPAALDRAIELGVTEPIGSGTWRLHPAVRELHLGRRWGTTARDRPSPELAAISERLSRHYQDRGDEVEALYHQFAVAPEAALRRFEQLFEEAQERFDLARARDLLEAFGDRRSLLGAEYTTTWDERRAQLDARSYWLDDWYRTSRFVEPEDSRAPVDELLEARGGHALQLWAKGGAGKSMHLRWLISRRCVPAGIACARVDFDAVDLMAAADEPWLILLALAEQLNRQLRGAPFTALLKEADFDPDRLRRRTSVTDAGRDRVRAPRERAGEPVAERFAAELGALEDDERVLIVLDTLEQPLDPRWNPGGLALVSAVLGDIGAALRHAHNTNVVLAGRLNLRDRITGLDELLPGLDTHRLTGFSRLEAEDYLRNRRQIESYGHISAALDGLSDSDERRIVPFNLALVADVIEHDPNVSPEEILAYSQHDLLYLIKRVLERIDPMVRWVLRYGVIARSLDIGFLREALGPSLIEAMSGDLRDDDLSTDVLPTRLRGADPLWSSDLLASGGALDFDRLWSRLTAYAGEASWLSFDSTAGEQVLQFHPEVVEPMRRVLGDKPVVPRLHRAAVEYFERRIRDEPEHLSRLLREDLYHRIAIAEDGALVWWRGLMSASGDPELRRQLARELGLSARGEQAVAEASLEYAWASAQVAVYAVGGLPSDAVEGLRKATTAAHRLRAGRLALARAAVAVAQNAPSEAAAAAAAAIDSDEPAEDRLWLALVYANFISQLDPTAAGEILEQAQGLTKPGSEEWTRVAFMRAQIEAGRDRTRLALRIVEQAVRAEPSPEPADLTQLAWAKLDDGDARGALEEIAKARTDDPAESTRRLTVEARCHLARFDPTPALDALRESAGRLQESSEPAMPARERLKVLAFHAERIAEARVMQLEVDEALNQLAQASEHWRRLGELGNMWQCRLQRAEVQLRVVGDLNAAGLELTAIELPTGARHPRFELLAAELDDRRGYHESARAHLDTAVEVLVERQAAPSELIHAAISALATEAGADEERFCAILVEAVEQVDSPTRKLVRLHPLRHVQATLLNVDGGLRDRLRAAVPSASMLDMLDPYDRSVLSLADADLDRILGRHDEARDTLRSAASTLLGGSTTSRLWLEGALSTRLWLEESDRLALAAAAESTESPLARAAVLILEAEAAALMAQHDLRDDLLHRAADALAGERINAGQWQARMQAQLSAAATARGEFSSARSQAELAASLYERLGDQLAVERMLTIRSDTPADVGTVPLTHVDLDYPRTLIELRLDGGALASSIAGHGGVPQFEIAKFSDVALREALGDRDPFGSRTLELLLNPVGLARQMQGAVFGPLGGGWLAPDLDIAIRIADPRLAALPWELLAATVVDGGPGMTLRRVHRVGAADQLDADDVHALQEGLHRAGFTTSEDGILGPQTIRALADFQRSAGLPATGRPDALTEQRLLATLMTRSVTVLASASGVDEMSSRNVRQSQLPSDYVYASHGVSPMTLNAVSLPELAGALAERPPVVLHIEAGLLDEFGQAVLDLAGEWQFYETPSNDSDRFTATALGDALRGLPAKPIVVLAPPAPRSRPEIARQMLLRNAFAAELFGTGTARAVVGLGLTSYEMHTSLWDDVIRMLAAGCPLGDLIESVRRRAADQPAGSELALVYASAVLFARSAELRPAWGT